jgi:hypothetical protein
MLRWRAAPSKHPPRTPCLKPATLVLRGSLRSHLRMRVAALRPLRGNFFGNLMMVRVAAMCRPSLAQACRAATPTALMLRCFWPKDKASKHPPRTLPQARTPRPSRVASLPPQDEGCCVAARSPANAACTGIQNPAPSTQRPHLPKSHRYQKPRPPLTQASPFTRQHLPVA